MYHELAKRVGLIVDVFNNPYIETSQPVTMADANAVKFDLLIYAISTSDVISVGIEGSNDLENWTLFTGTLITKGTVGYHVSALEDDVGFVHVRLKYAFGNAVDDYCVFSSGLTTFAE